MTNLLLLGSAGFIAVGTFRLFDPLLPAIAEEYGRSVGEVSSVVTAYILAYGLFQIVHGPLGDRVGKLRVITVALALTSATTVASAWAESVNGLAALRFAAGMMAGAVPPLAMAHIGDTVPYESRQATIARFLMAVLIGQMVAGSLAGIFAEYFGWRMALVVFGGAGLVIAGFLWPVAARAPRHVHGAADGPRVTHLDLLRERPARVVWGASFLEGSLIFGAVPYVGAYLRLEFQLDYATIGLTLACFGVGGLIYSFNVKRIVRLLDERRLVLTGGALGTASYAAMALAPVWQVFVPAMTVIGIGFFFTHGILQVRATEIAPRARGTALSGFVLGMFIGQSVGVFAMSYVVDGPGYRVAFALAAAGIVVFTAWVYRALFVTPGKG